ncbi:MAG: family 20 glycosylhydrolase [Bacteroidota bacterium]|nr:family 20 glycosylhydrolase [Bacteroidota bacterium]
MKRNSLLLLFLLFISISLSAIHAQYNEVNLMPVPSKLTAGEGKFRVKSNFAMSVKGDCPDRLYSYASRILHRLSGRTGLFFPQDYVTNKSNSDTVSFYIYCDQKANVKLGEDESYSLNITPDRVELRAKNDLGIMRGLETFNQLLSSDEDGYYMPAVKIEDSPRFAWRGIMMDVSRHFMPVDVIKRNLDLMASVKFNVFHWHLSDDQGMRVETKSLPKLNELSSDGMYYTQDQIKDVIKYAQDRGIRVIPEFDIPGHSTSWLTAYPELASLPGPFTIERNWGVFDPTFNPTIEATYEFFDKFFKEISSLFPDEYMHIGGDENSGKQWNSNPQIQAYMKEHNIPNNHTLQSVFTRRIQKILAKYGKIMIGWDEIQHPELPKDIVIQSWRGEKGLAEAAKNGFHVILSNGYYVDLIQPAEFHYLNDPIGPNSKLSDEERKFVLGGEATMWAELVTPENVDSRLWPRTAVIAERLWSPVTVRDVDDMYRRMDRVSFYLEDAGSTHRRNQETMLRRLTNDNDISALKNFVDVIEPVKLYSRHNQGVKYTSYSPYTRVVDAAVPDVKTARDFRKLVDKYLSKKDEISYNEIKTWLTLWKSNHQELLKTIKLSPVLKEIESLSEDLSLMSEGGLQALEMIHSQKKADKSWLDKQTQLIEKAKQPRGQTEIMVTSAIEKLVKSIPGA